MEKTIRLIQNFQFIYWVFLEIFNFKYQMKFGRVGASLSFVFKERESNNTTSAMDLTERIDDFYPYHVALSHQNWAKAFKKVHLKWFT